MHDIIFISRCNVYKILDANVQIVYAVSASHDLAWVYGGGEEERGVGDKTAIVK